MPLRQSAATTATVITDLPTGQKGQTFERRTPTAILTLPSGRLVLSAVYLPVGTIVTSLTFASSTTALASGTSGWAALFDPSQALLGQSANDSAIAWAANAAKTFTLGAPVTTAVAGWHYMGVCIVATTPPTLVAVAPYNGGASMGSLAPVLGGLYNTGLTTTAPATASGFAASSIPYGCWA